MWLTLTVDLTGCTSKQEIRARVAGVLANRRGYARVQLSGELGADIDIQALDFDDLTLGLDAPPLVRFGAYSVAYNLAELSQEPTVRGQFVRDVRASGLPGDECHRIIITGLRALDSRTDLEVI
jgi:DNA repair protein SbcD/Mre11